MSDVNGELQASCKLICYACGPVEDPEDCFNYHSSRHGLPHVVLQTDETSHMDVEEVTDKAHLFPSCFWEKAFGFFGCYYVVH